MFENLSDRLEGAFKSLKGQGKISEINIATTVKEIRRALVEADVNYKIAKEFTDTVKDKALGQEVLTSVSPGQLMVKIVQDELTALMGGEQVDINIKGSPAIILIAGLQGSGKTTFSAKLANHIKTKLGRSPMLAACDIYRPAAINQLQVLGEQIGVHVYADIENKNAVDIAKKAINYAKTNNHNVVIVDTAGRLAVDEEMMDEITRLKEALNPSETLFVVDSMTGQDAVNTAKAFNDRLNFDGVVLTKLDGDTRGGAALSIKYVVQKPIKFVSRGEKMDTLELFYPDRMAQRILGMGDIVSFVEKAQEQYDQEKAEELQRKIRKNQFDFEDFLQQLKQIKKMGNMKDLLGMIPGIGKQIKDMDIDEKQFSKLEAMIYSMTPEERNNPDLMTGSRRQRIAAGSGSTIQDVNQFMKQFEEMRKMMKMMNKMGGGAKAARALGGMMGKR
ncbi:MAG: signal recognition particle protein [Chitinophagales bacterium]|jgi:signal recognition particle subunit SRP54|nr:signal recognition particle protein [Bacteroidota bacterium]MBL0281028.1 signal recognition particle protein [Bacteroidota bacterium]